MSLLLIRRTSEDEQIEARIEIFARKLERYPIDLVLRTIEQWPSDHVYWPAWQEIEEVLNQTVNEHRRALPPPPRRVERHHDPELYEPFKSRLQWNEFAESMRKLRDPSEPMLARAALLRMGMSVEARQRPHAVAKGWA